MIEYIKGSITELAPTSVVIENQGLGYFVQISLNTYSDIQNMSGCKLYIYEVIREDAYLLFGFSNKEERSIFLKLIAVSGVGANTARMILSSLTVEELKSCIMSDNVDALKSVKGIGAKTAQRILVDLKDKIMKSGFDQTSLISGSSASAEVRTEAVAALQMLGFALTVSQKVVGKIMADKPGMRVEDVIKAALKLL